MRGLFAAVLVASSVGSACRSDERPFRATDCAPGEGHPAGGQIVFIQGEGFDPKRPASVSFGATPSPRVHVVSASKVQVEVPPGAPRLAVSIKVEQAGRSAIVPGVFKYFDPSEAHEHGPDGGH